MINWAYFEVEVQTGLEKGFDSGDSFARFIAEQYLATIKRGGDGLAKNSVSLFNHGLLESSLKQMFQNSLDLNVPVDFFAYVGTALLSAWSSAQILALKLPTGFSIVGSVKITVPGIITPVITIPPQSSSELFAKRLREFFESHSKTVTGIYSGLSLSSPPTPIALPFIGYN